MIDFSTLQGVTIPEGVVTQIESGGVVLWKVQTSVPVILQVEKITSNTYAAETTYTGEQFVLLDIYPKTNGTVSVTYGGLTKTVTDTSGAAKPNAQQVFFGTFNGVTDSVTTPAVGELTIAGEYDAFGCGTYFTTAKTDLPSYCSCITAAYDLGNIKYVPLRMFSQCDSLTDVAIPEGVTGIGDYAFYGCTALLNVTIPESVTNIGAYAFSGCTALLNVTIPESVTNIGASAFYLGIGSGPRTVNMMSATPPILAGDNVFDMSSTNKIVLKNGGLAAYKAAEYWSEYANHITEVS